MQQRYVRHGDADAPPRLSDYQAWWAMDGLGTDGREWTRQEKLERIVEAGFEGILLFDDLAGSRGDRWRHELGELGLQLAVGTNAATRDEVRRDLERAAELGAAFVNLQTRDYFLVGDDVVGLLTDALATSDDLGLACQLETHRGCVTQDLLRTVEYVARIPEMLIAADLSHYVVSGGFAISPGETWPLDPRIDEAFSVILARCASLHGRVGTGHQVQIDIDRDGRYPVVEHYRRWWAQGMSSFRASASPGDVLPFVCELGPPAAAITVAKRGKRRVEVSDRWQQALLLQRIANEIWDNVTAGELNA